MPNLYYVCIFYELYSGRVIFPQVEGKSPEDGDEFLPQVGGKLEHEIFRIPWGHHKLLIDKFRNDPDRALFYVQWALEGSSQPMGVSEYQLSKLLSDEVKSDLPSIAEIEDRLNAEK